MRNRRVGQLLFGGLTASTFGLGTWQVSRFLEDKAQVETVEIDASKLRFKDSVLVGPRPVQGKTKSAFYVYAPTEDSLVCLGWTDEQPSVQVLEKTQVVAPHTLKVLVHPGESGNSFAPTNPDTGPFLWVERARMLERVGLSPQLASLSETYEQVETSSSLKLHPKARPEPYLTKWTHAGYAVTWYSLTLAGLVMMRRMVF